MQSLTCPKCQAQMQEGFIPIFRYAQGPQVGRWAAGTIKPSFYWLGLGWNNMRQIVTYRCSACGYLESFAP